MNTQRDILNISFMKVKACIKSKRGIFVKQQAAGYWSRCPGQIGFSIKEHNVLKTF